MISTHLCWSFITLLYRSQPKYAIKFILIGSNCLKKMWIYVYTILYLLNNYIKYLHLNKNKLLIYDYQTNSLCSWHNKLY